MTSNPVPYVLILLGVIAGCSTEERAESRSIANGTHYADSVRAVKRLSSLRHRDSLYSREQMRYRERVLDYDRSTWLTELPGSHGSRTLSILLLEHLTPDHPSLASVPDSLIVQRLAVLTKNGQIKMISSRSPGKNARTYRRTAKGDTFLIRLKKAEDEDPYRAKIID